MMARRSRARAALSTLCAGAFTCLIACGGSGSGPAVRSLVASSTQASGRELVLDDAKANFAQASYPATLSGTPVTLTRITSTRLGLYVPPAIAAGSLRLDATADGVAYIPVSIGISTVAPPGDAASFEQAQIAAVNAKLQAWQQAWSARADLEPIFDAALADVQAFDAAFPGLDAQSQQAAANYLADNVFVDSAAPTTFTALHAEVAARWVSVGGDLAASASLSTISWKLAAAAMLARDTAALADAYGTATTATLEPASANALGDATDGTSSIVTLNFNNGQVTAMPITLVSTNLSRADAASAVPLVVQAAGAFQGLADAWTSINESLPAALGAAPRLSEVAQLSAVHEAPPAGLSIQNVAPTPAIGLSAFTPGTDTTQVQFTAFGCGFNNMGNTAFSFQVLYNDGVFPSQTATFPAQLICLAN